MKNYFEKCTTHDEAKKLYRRLAMKLHPDKGGDDAAFQELNRQYRDFCEGKRTSSADGGTQSSARQSWDWKSDIINILRGMGIDIDSLNLNDIVSNHKISDLARSLGTDDKIVKKVESVEMAIGMIGDFVEAFGVYKNKKTNN